MTVKTPDLMATTKEESDLMLWIIGLTESKTNLWSVFYTKVSVSDGFIIRCHLDGSVQCKKPKPKQKNHTHS